MHSDRSIIKQKISVKTNSNAVENVQLYMNAYFIFFYNVCNPSALQ